MILSGAFGRDCAARCNVDVDGFYVTIGGIGSRKAKITYSEFDTNTRDEAIEHLRSLRDWLLYVIGELEEMSPKKEGE